MADNVTLNSGSGGDTIRADDDGTAKWQYVKIAYGADNTQSIVTSTATNPLPVALSDTDNAVLDTIETNTDFGAVTGNGTAAGSLRVTLASDTTGVVSVDDNGGSLTVDGTVTANAGTGTFTVDNGGTFAVQAAQSGSWTVDLSATDNAVLDTIETNTDFGTVTGGGTEAGALRVTLANDSTGVVSVDDGGGTLTVDGTVTANLSATDNAVLDSIDANTTRGSSHYRNIDANAEDAIKGSAGTLHWIHAMNLTASVAYVHLYDATAANVTPGTTTPDYTFPVPTTGDTNGAGFVIRLDQEFANAITLVVTTTTDGSTGDPGTNGVFVNAGYS